MVRRFSQKVWAVLLVMILAGGCALKKPYQPDPAVTLQLDGIMSDAKEASHAVDSYRNWFSILGHEGLDTVVSRLRLGAKAIGYTPLPYADKIAKSLEFSLQTLQAAVEASAALQVLDHALGVRFAKSFKRSSEGEIMLEIAADRELVEPARAVDERLVALQKRLSILLGAADTVALSEEAKEVIEPIVGSQIAAFLSDIGQRHRLEKMARDIALLRSFHAKLRERLGRIDALVTQRGNNK